jgi:hypothetical protein
MDDKTVIETLDRTVMENLTGLRSPVRGWLTVWNGPLRGRDFPLREGRNFVGSDRLCSINLGDVCTSDLLFNIRIHGGTWTLIDLDSDTGLILNDEPVFRHELRDEDWIKIGNMLFRAKIR